MDWQTIAYPTNEHKQREKALIKHIARNSCDRSSCVELISFGVRPFSGYSAPSDYCGGGGNGSVGWAGYAFEVRFVIATSFSVSVRADRSYYEWML